MVECVCISGGLSGCSSLLEDSLVHVLLPGRETFSEFFLPYLETSGTEMLFDRFFSLFMDHAD